MTVQAFEWLGAGGYGPLTLLGELSGWDGSDEPIYRPLILSSIGEAYSPLTPQAPTLAVTLLTRTSARVTVTAPDNTGRPPITEYRVYRANNGAAATLVRTETTAASFTWDNTGLATNTPEIVFTYTVYAVNADGIGAVSNAVAVQWNATPTNPPTAPSGLAAGVLTTTTVPLTWQATTDATVTKQAVYRNGVLFRDDILTSARSYTVSGLTAGTTHTFDVRRINSTGWSPASNAVTVTTPLVDPPTVTMLIGCSASNNSHGGTEDWDGWRVYSEGEMLTRANRTGTLRPLFLSYSKDGSNLGGSNPNYTTVYNEVLTDLNSFYYTSATGQTVTARWGIQLFWSNGNENHDKGALSLPHTAAGIAAFSTSQRALYDAVHYIDPTTSQRRFPDAYAGSNPTQNAEQSGVVADYLHPSARYHDFIMWSMYPPGRQNTEADPTYNFPSFVESNRTNSTLGFLIRCFYRTKQAQLQARIDTGNPAFPMMITCGEVGIGDDPDDSTTRPYYAVHGLFGAMAKLSAQYELPMPNACWWDNQVDAGGPQNILDDEPTTTNPSTRAAIQAWRSYNHQFSGTHPVSWAGNPKASWKTSGSPV